MKDIANLIQHYKDEWCSQKSMIRELETYKWIAFRHFKENCHKGDSLNSKWINTVFGKTKNLLSSQHYYPLKALKKFFSYEGEPEKIKGLFEELLIPGEIPTKERVYNFKSGTKSLMQLVTQKGCKDSSGNDDRLSPQDVRAISVYLSMYYPNDFYIYKNSVFIEFAKEVDYEIKTKNDVEQLFEYQSLCDKVKVELLKNKELIDFYKKWLINNSFEDDNFNLLTQDFIYAIAVHLNEEKRDKPLIGKCNEVTVANLQHLSSPTKPAFKGVKGVDYISINRKKQESGTSGEMWALNIEKKRLQERGIDAEKVRYVAKYDGDGYGYDIRSVEDDGVTPRYIEVKTTTGNISEPIYFTDTELDFSKMNREHYYIYRVFHFNKKKNYADLAIIKASLDELNAVATEYRARISFNDKQ